MKRRTAIILLAPLMLALGILAAYPALRTQPFVPSPGPRWTETPLPTSSPRPFVSPNPSLTSSIFMITETPHLRGEPTTAAPPSKTPAILQTGFINPPPATP